MALQLGIKGLLLFYHSHKAHNICKEIFVKILIYIKCYQIKDHPTSSCPKSKDYKICSLCAPLEHTHRECTSYIRKCVNSEEDNSEEDNDHSSLTMSCHFRKKSYKNKQEIIQRTNSHHYSSCYEASHSHSHPVHSYSLVLAHSNSPGFSLPMTSVKTNGGPDTITSPIQSVPTFEKSSVFFDQSAYLSPLSKTVRNRAPLKWFRTVL